MPAISGIHHISITVPDLERSVPWYADLLGLTKLMEEHGLGAVDLRHYDVPEDIRRHMDLGMCWATWSVPLKAVAS